MELYTQSEEKAGAFSNQLQQFHIWLKTVKLDFRDVNSYLADSSNKALEEENITYH